VTNLILSLPRKRALAPEHLLRDVEEGEGGRGVSLQKHPGEEAGPGPDIKDRRVFNGRERCPDRRTIESCKIRDDPSPLFIISRCNGIKRLPDSIRCHPCISLPGDYLLPGQEGSYKRLPSGPIGSTPAPTPAPGTPRSSRTPGPAPDLNAASSSSRIRMRIFLSGS